METTTITTKTSSPVHRVAVNALAIVGFIVLIVLGMALAIYAASFVPKAVSRLGSASVYLSSIFVPASTTPALEVVPAGTTVSFPDTTPVASTSPVVVVPTSTQTPKPGVPTTVTYPTGGAKPVPTLFGLPDLTVSIVSTGYLTSADTSSFVKSNIVPNELRGAVKFTIINKGTNASGRFYFTATLPTSTSYTFSSDAQASLLPGEHIDYVLGFDRTNSGDNRTISVEVDSDKSVLESNENNNNDSTVMTIN